MAISVNKILSYSDNILKSKINNKSKKFTIPVVMTPLVAYMDTSSGREKTRTIKILKEQEHLAKPVTERTEFNTKQLKKMGVNERDIKKYLKSDGSPTEDGKKIFRENHKTFKGEDGSQYPKEQPYYSPNEETYTVEIEDFKSSLPDMRLSPQLDNVYKNPSFSSARGLMKSILGEDLLNKLEADIDDAWDCMSNIKSMTMDILGFGG